MSKLNLLLLLIALGIIIQLIFMYFNIDICSASHKF